MRSDLFYQNRLTKYFTENFSQHNNIEFFVNPTANQWDLYIPELDKRYILTCDDKGYITSEVKNGT